MLSSRVIMTAPWWQCKSKSFMLLLFLCVKLRNRLLATEAPLAVVSWHQFLGILDRKIGWTNTIADGWWSAQYFDGMISYSPINQDRIPISSHLFAREKNRSSSHCRNCTWGRNGEIKLSWAFSISRKPSSDNDGQSSRVPLKASHMLIFLST